MKGSGNGQGERTSELRAHTTPDCGPIRPFAQHSIPEGELVGVVLAEGEGGSRVAWTVGD
jgi:hypothetical protein